ncbi:hypothetical protein ACA910_017736 [Epithemia clementina (nom. ined.)]
MSRCNYIQWSVITLNRCHYASDPCRTPILFKTCVGASFRRFSKDSLGGDNKATTTIKSSTTNAQASAEASRSGPIRIKSTPRSAAAAKIRTKVDDSETATNWGIGEISDSHKTYAELLLPHASVGENKFQLASYGEESLYTLVLLRHGESEWNRENRFTGWSDVNLTRQGEMEARTAGRLLFENGIEIDHAFTSVLKRASFSCNMCLNMAEQHWVPVTKSWRLNERHYGALQGYCKDNAWQQLGLDQELVMQMRRSYDVPPPRMEDDHPYWHGNDRRYKMLNKEELEASRAESLKDTTKRIVPFFNSLVVPAMRAGMKCLIVSHANTIRTLVKHIDRITDEDIKGMTIPTGIPLLYRLDRNMRPVDPEIELEFQYMVEPKGYTWATSRAHGFHGVYLGDLERLQDIQKKRDASMREWQRIILRNVGKSLGWDMDHVTEASSPKVMETRQLWWQIQQKMNKHEYGNMLLLVKMEDMLEDLMYSNKQKFLTMRQYEAMIEKLHVDAEGRLVEPFVALNDRQSRKEREQLWYESLALDLEGEALIK